MSYVASDVIRRYGAPLIKDWLYKDNWTKSDQDTFESLYSLNIFGVRPFGSYFDDVLNEKNWNAYAKANQIDYSDIYDPRKMMSSFGQNNARRGAINFLSDNVKRLYD